MFQLERQHEVFFDLRLNTIFPADNIIWVPIPMRNIVEHFLDLMFNNSLICPAHAFPTLISNPSQTIDSERRQSKSKIPTLSIHSQCGFRMRFYEIETHFRWQRNYIRYQKTTKQRPARMSMVKNTIKLQSRLELWLHRGYFAKFTPCSLNRFKMTKQWNPKQFKAINSL